MKLKAYILTVALTLGSFYTQKAMAHCEIPCGIYNDKARITQIAEDISTISKSSALINKLSKDGEKNYNQIVRWVTNKEKHAEKIQQTVMQYFMTQRLKPVSKADKEAYAKYQTKLELLHHLLHYSMKAKQSTDLTNISKLKETLKAFSDAYFGKEESHSHEHSHQHGHGHSH